MGGKGQETRKINETVNSFFGIINKINKSVGTLIKGIKKKHKLKYQV